ncbi:MAG TPA: metal ABC transporter permease [Methylomirabilota bacterium]|nr:metal ABC transporter permease [Methylomirabilota bacterium]
MNELIPQFNWHDVVVSPWTDGFSSTIWIVLMGAMVATACGLVGNYLILRRMALVGDAISHSVLPGLAIAFLLTGSRGSGVMFFGALLAGVATTLLIELIHKKSRVKQDAAIGIAFTSLFAIGVILISVYAASGKVDLDQECVLYGEIGLVWLEEQTVIAGATIGPESVVRMTAIALITVVLVVLFYKELLVSSFDPGLASSLGINAGLVHYALMSWLSVVVVSAFESVGAILVIAMLILPGATASLLTYRLPRVMALTVLHGVISSVGGLHLALWLGCSTAGAMVVVGSGLFICAWIFSPSQGLLRRWLVKVEDAPLDPTISTKPMKEAHL